MPSSTFTLLTALAGAATVAAHGHVTNIVINGQSFSGFLPNIFPYMQNPPAVAGWTAANTDNGFVGPESFASADIICHRSATNAKAHAVVAAGDRIMLKWDTWPESHKGPVIDYLASCGTAGCETVDKTSLEFFKISEAGLINGAQAPGQWASDTLIANNNSWLVEIPANIAPGNYVLRHEVIALHSAGQLNGAQNYPQCFNLQVTGSGTVRPQGVKGTALYTPNDAGILFNIYTSLASYPIPGPALIAGAKAVAQGTSAIVASATAAPVQPTTTSQAAVQPTTTAQAVIPTTTSQALVVPTTSAAVVVQPTERIVTVTVDRCTAAANTAAAATAAAVPTTTVRGPARPKGPRRVHARQLASN
ncbi:hypothetical protein OQA88_9055 [Cercophora sp. LCS_1]